MLDDPSPCRAIRRTSTGTLKSPRVASHQALRDSLRSSFEPVLAEAVPDRLLAAARSRRRGILGLKCGAAEKPHQSAAPVRPLPKWAALAASFVLGALALQFATSLRNSPSITERNGHTAGRRSITTGVVEPTVRVASDSPIRTHRHQLSFQEGQYCRTFQLPQSTRSAAWPAMKQATGKSRYWLVRTARPPPTRISPAGSNLPRPSFRPSTTTLPVTHWMQSRKRAHGPAVATYSVR